MEKLEANLYYMSIMMRVELRFINCCDVHIFFGFKIMWLIMFLKVL